ncbi:MAG: aldo/keto reductase [Deltaproteobacteria bacterium]|nr:aldo/keto reductase [Deltaproteobacteria bacterium]
MTRLGLGLAALGRPGYITLGHGADLGDTGAAAMERRAHEVLDAAWAAGVRWFDAARSYGRAEDFLASWLAARGIAPADVTVSSKWGYTYTAGWQVVAAHHEVKDHTLPALERQLAESRARLGPYLSLYQVHSATLDSGILDDARVLDRLGELRDGGLAIGLSLSGARQRATLERALGIVVGGRPLWSAVQATWNLLERSVEPALRAAADAGLRVLIKEALANGRLATRGAPPALREEAARLGVGPDAAAIAVALAQPFAGVVLSGAVTAEQLASNARALEVRDARDLPSLVEPAERYWTERGRLAWT